MSKDKLKDLLVTLALEAAKQSLKVNKNSEEDKYFDLVVKNSLKLIKKYRLLTVVVNEI